MYWYVPCIVACQQYILVCTTWVTQVTQVVHTVVSLWRRLPWRKAMCAGNKPSFQQRLLGVRKRLEQLQNEACVWLMSIPVRTSMYPYHYVPICHGTCITWTLYFLKFDVILSYRLHRNCTTLYLTLRALPGCMRYLRVLIQVRTRTYQYVKVLV